MDVNREAAELELLANKKGKKEKQEEKATGKP